VRHERCTAHNEIDRTSVVEAVVAYPAGRVRLVDLRTLTTGLHGSEFAITVPHDEKIRAAAAVVQPPMDVWRTGSACSSDAHARQTAAAAVDANADTCRSGHARCARRTINSLSRTMEDSCIRPQGQLSSLMKRIMRPAGRSSM
jgi:hypothetical protein